MCADLSVPAGLKTARPPAAPAHHPAAPPAERKALGELGQLLQLIVGAIAAEFAADASSLWLLNAQADAIHCVFHDPGSLPAGRSAVSRSRYRREEISGWPWLLHLHRPLVLRDCPRHPSLGHAREWFAGRRVQTTLLVPLRRQERPSAWLLLFHHREKEYRPEELALAESRAPSLAVALEVACAAVEWNRAAIAAERQRMARELHDTLAQGFTAILFQLEAAREQLAPDHKAALIPLERARELARESLADARRAICAMRPRALDQNGLVAALESLVQDMAAGSGVRAEFSVRGSPRSLPAEIEVNLLRIVQEAVRNALRHARASSIRVALDFGSHLIKATIEDDGCGFDPAAAPSPAGFGFLTMRERAESLSGKLLISSHPGHGARVRVKIPLRKT